MKTIALRHDSDSLLGVLDADPLASMRGPGSALADLAFGSLTRTAIHSHARPLALLPAETLQLDLSDPSQRQFGDYELLELVGEGGMGVVYRARQQSLDREVAVKLLAAGPWASREFIERFRREAQNAARMQHPNIVAIYEVGSAEELHFFSMRLVHGPSLAAVVRSEGKLPPQRAASLLRTIAEALDYAHRLGVLHLDLKPANVLIDENGSPHVADFGLARRLDNALVADTDEVSGTPSYMAPEQAQARSQKITPATDIWGLGAILYELVTGKPPFLGDSPQGTLKLVVEGKLTSPRHYTADLPRDLEAIILKCMARNAAERYPSARALADDLGRFIEHRAVKARPLNAPQRVLRWAKREPKLAIASALGLLALIVGLVATTQQWRRAEGNAKLAQATLWDSRRTTAQRQIADGEAYLALDSSVANLREMEARGAHAEAALERLRIGTVLANAPQLFDVISLGESINAVEISPNGKSVAVATDRIVHLIDVASGAERWKVDTRDKSFRMIGHDQYNNGPLPNLRFSADGHRLIAYPPWSSPILRPHYVDTVLIDVDAGHVVEPPKEFADFLASGYATDGGYALLFDKHERAQRWRTQPWSPAGDLVRIDSGEGNPLARDSDLDEAQLPANGDPVIAVFDEFHEFRTLDPERLTPRRTLKLDDTQGRASVWMLSRDGKQLAIGTQTGYVALWNLGDGSVRQLQPAPVGWISWIEWSPDDSRLVVTSDEPNELRVFDSRSGGLAALPIDLAQGTPDSAGFGSDAKTLWASSRFSGAKLWELPESGFPLRPPVASAPAMAGGGLRFAMAADPLSRLIATSDNGQLKLWREPSSALLDPVAAPMVTDTLRFDGRHLVSVNGNRIGVFDLVTNTSPGTTIELQQPPTFAGLSADGKSIIAIAGRELTCRDWRSGQPCWPGLTLPNSALRLSMAAKAPLLAVSTGTAEADRFHEHIQLIDLTSGKQQGEDIALDGPLAALRLSDDGHRLLAWQDIQSPQAESNTLRIIDTATTKVAANLVHTGKDRHHIADARFADDGSLWSSSRKRDEAEIWHWDAAGNLIARTQTRRSMSVLPLPASRGAIALAAAADHAPLLIAADGTTHALHVPNAVDMNNVASLSADGKLLALATHDGVALIDVASNELLLPEFKLALPHQDTVQQLAFAADGSRIVGRTLGGHWLQWRVTADARPLGEIEQSLRLRDFTPQAEGFASPLPEEQRRGLRSADPEPTAAPSTANAGAAIAISSQAQPDPRYRPRDLAPIANVEPRAPMNRLLDEAQSLPNLPHGLQRYDGVDFLLGRAVQLSGAPHNPLNTVFPALSERLPIEAQRVAAIDVLVFEYYSVTAEIGSVHLHYADGSERALPILIGRDVLPFWYDDWKEPGQRRFGWLGSFAAQLNYSSGEATLARSYVVRLENPEPGRSVAAISFGAPAEAVPGLLFLALTLEPVDTPH